jgi:hypothetical protein
VVISIIYIAVFGGIDDQGKVHLRSLWESSADFTLSLRMAVLYVTLICVFLFQSLRQVKLRFNSLASNMFILIPSLFLIYFYSTRLYYDQDLRKLIISSGESDPTILEKLDVRQFVYWIFILAFSLAILATSFFTLRKPNGKHRA